MDNMEEGGLAGIEFRFTVLFVRMWHGIYIFFVFLLCLSGYHVLFVSSRVIFP